VLLPATRQLGVFIYSLFEVYFHRPALRKRFLSKLHYPISALRQPYSWKFNIQTPPVSFLPTTTNCIAAPPASRANAHMGQAWGGDSSYTLKPPTRTRHVINRLYVTRALRIPLHLALSPSRSAPRESTKSGGGAEITYLNIAVEIPPFIRQYDVFLRHKFPSFHTWFVLFESQEDVVLYFHFVLPTEIADIL